MPKNNSAQKLYSLLTGIFLITTLSGCALFPNRSPEDKVTDAKVVYNSLTDTAIALGERGFITKQGVRDQIYQASEVAATLIEQAETYLAEPEKGEELDYVLMQLDKLLESLEKLLIPDNPISTQSPISCLYPKPPPSYKSLLL